MPSQKNPTFGKLATANAILVANAFVWYLLAFNMLRDLLQQTNSTQSEHLVIVAINTGAIVVSGLLGSIFFCKFKSRHRFILFWIAIGVVISIVPLGLDMSSLTIIAIISIVFGLYFGLGMPATMGFHAAVTKIEERAKFGGVAFLIIGVISSIAGLVIFDSLFASCLLLALVRFLGLGVFFLQRKEVAYQEKDESKVLNYQNILSNKSFIFYFIPWFMITLINYMIFPIQQPIFEHEKLDYNTLMAVEYIITAVFAVLSGFIADKLGRKRLAIIGFIMLGIGYAVIGIFPISYLKFSSILYVFADGIAWGIFYVLFIFTLWGDIAQGKHADKIYFLGALPYVFSFFIQELFTPVLTKYFDAIKNPTIIFSFASIFLFLAVLPLIYAPETLPEKTLKDRELVTYIEKAQKIVKKQRKSSSREEIQKTSKQTNSEDYEKARALAEKYY